MTPEMLSRLERVIAQNRKRSHLPQLSRCKGGCGRLIEGDLCVECVLIEPALRLNDD